MCAFKCSVMRLFMVTASVTIALNAIKSSMADSPQEGSQNKLEADSSEGAGDGEASQDGGGVMLSIPDGYQNLKMLENLIGTTAHYKGECDPDLHEKHVSAIYDAGTADSLWESKLLLNDFIGQNPTLANKSCYGVGFNEAEQFLFENYMDCVTCKTSHCCMCVLEEPMVFEKQPFGPCLLKESAVGDMCDLHLYNEMFDKVHKPFFDGINAAKSRRDYVNTIINYTAAFEMFYFQRPPGAQRFTCSSQSNNMACLGEENSQTGLCGCLNYTAHFQYKSVENPIKKLPNYCVATKGSVCNIIFKSEIATFDKLSKCGHSDTCQEAIPGLYCDNLDDPDCNFDLPTGEIKEEKMMTEPLLYWGISSCGGPWKDKKWFSRSGATIFYCNFTFCSLPVVLFLQMLFLIIGKH